MNTCGAHVEAPGRLAGATCLAGAATFAAIVARGRDLGGGARSTVFRAELLRHPGFRAEYALEERRHVEIGIEARPVQAEAGWGDFDVGQIFVGGAR